MNSLKRKRIIVVDGQAAARVLVPEPLDRDVVDIIPTKTLSFVSSAPFWLDQNDEWAVQRACYMTQETIAPLSDDSAISLPAIAS